MLTYMPYRIYSKDLYCLERSGASICNECYLPTGAADATTGWCLSCHVCLHWDCLIPNSTRYTWTTYHCRECAACSD